MLFVMLHIVSGTISILTAVVAFAVKKGSATHRKAGVLFVVNMLVMSLTGGILATINGEYLNLVAGGLTFYLVATAYLSVKDKNNEMKKFHYGLVVFGSTVGIFGLLIGSHQLINGLATIDGKPIHVLFVFSSIAICWALFDVKMLVKKINGKQRLQRHIWRIGFATFIAAASLFLGQSQVFPEYVRNMVFLSTPVLLSVILTLFWFIKIRYWKL